MDELTGVSNGLVARDAGDIDVLGYSLADSRAEVSDEEARPIAGRENGTALLRDAAQVVLDQVPVGVALLDSAMRVIVTNRALDLRMQAQDGVALRQNVFTLTNAEAHQQLAATIGRPAASKHPAPPRLAVRVPRGGAQPDLHLLVTAARNDQWCIWVFDPLGQRELSAELMRDVHGLTAAESKVARALFTGLSTKEAAATLGISVNTVKAHLKGIFRKCDVRSQAELSQLLALGCWKI